ncbi:MAG: hypothetical protein GY940_25820 [bacterium]|nr:hypothetical protein [bacterium]
MNHGNENKAKFQHVVITRFNIGRTDSPWMDHRTRLFERFCLPSFQAQTCQNFTWLIFCDQDTPEPWRSHLLGYESENIKILWMTLDADPYETRVWDGYRQAVADLLRGDEEFLVTTRCDNDDAVSVDFIKDIQMEAVSSQSSEFLNFPDGYIWYRGKVKRYWMPSNHFISYRETITSPENIITVMCEKHSEVEKINPIRQIKYLSRNWLQVCHDKNLFNKPWGAGSKWNLGKIFFIQRWKPETTLPKQFRVNYSVELLPVRK